MVLNRNSNCSPGAAPSTAIDLLDNINAQPGAVAQRLGDWLVTRGGNRPTRLVALLMLIVGSLGSVMYSTGVVAIFIPVALRIARNTGMSPAQVLMPVSYAALISGMLTLVAAAPNLIVNYELTRTWAEGLDFLSLTPIGLPVLILGVLHMMIARRWLGAGATAENSASTRPSSLSDLAFRRVPTRNLSRSICVGAENLA